MADNQEIPSHKPQLGPNPEDDPIFQRIIKNTRDRRRPGESFGASSDSDFDAD